MDKFLDECSKEELEEIEEISRQFKEARKKYQRAKKAYRNKVRKLGKWLDECEKRYED